MIHNFVNCETYTPAPDERSTKPLLIHLSNFRPVKRVLDCIRILAEVRKNVDARLLMVGDGPDRGPAQHLAAQLGVSASIEFVGKQNHVERLIRKAHVLLMPSEMESFGLAALEAMACGVVAIGTNVGGVPELITDGVDGCLENVGDIERLAARATELLTNSALHDKMAVAARKTAVDRFSTESLIPKYERYYQEVLSR